MYAAEQCGDEMLHYGLLDDMHYILAETLIGNPCKR